jgi:Domain of unknown function (DUF4384)
MRLKRNPYLLVVVILATLMGLSEIIALAQKNGSLVDDRPVSVTRRPKANRKRKVRRAVVKTTLLKLEWRVLKVRDDGSAEETNPRGIFHNGDRLRLAIKTNQNGFLYIIHQASPTSPGQIIFPDSRVNDGRNDVSKLQEVILPSNCPTGMKARDCALVVIPPAGLELFTLVFSRDPIINLPDSAMDASGGITVEALTKLRAGSGQILDHAQGSSIYSVLVTNQNTKDNEDIFETLPLKKGM